MKKPDILIYMSDQHSPNYMNALGNEKIRTPMLDSLVSQGTSFNQAYTACPLCVPARSAFLTSELPSKTGIFTNQDAVPERYRTFLHHLVLEGYETVLCGRMHFMGLDQRHGFTKRIMTDITADHWGPKDQMDKELGQFGKTLGMNHCLKLTGSGDSPVLAYDREVIAAAIDYLKKSHDKPQCIVVGTYGPHFPYVGEPEYFNYYMEELGASDLDDYNKEQLHTCLKHKEQVCSLEQLKSVRAAYMSMVTRLDQQIQKLHSKWKSYLAQQERKGCFVYLSDHGDQVGERHLFGKQTFYENSSRIPLIFEGEGILKGHVIDTPVSIMDIGPTLLKIVGGKPLKYSDGRDLLPAIRDGEPLEDIPVFSEYVEEIDGNTIPCRMVRYKEYKLITYAGYEADDQLFNIIKDPGEIDNLIQYHLGLVKKMRDLIYKEWPIDRIAEQYDKNRESTRVLQMFGQETHAVSKERWKIPPEATNCLIERIGR